MSPQTSSRGSDAMTLVLWLALFAMMIAAFVSCMSIQSAADDFKRACVARGGDPVLTDSRRMHYLCVVDGAVVDSR